MRCQELHFGTARRKLFASVVNGRHYEYRKGAAMLESSIAKASISKALQITLACNPPFLSLPLGSTQCISFTHNVLCCSHSLLARLASSAQLLLRCLSSARSSHVFSFTRAVATVQGPLL